MLRRIRRPAALLAPLLLLSAVATACGSTETIESGSLEGDAAYTLSGDVGTTPDVTWKGKLKADEAKTEVVSEGDGAELEADDEVLVNYYVGNGYSEDTALDTYAKDLAPLDFTVGGQIPEPAATATPDQIAQFLIQSLIATEVKAGDTIGTRKTITVNAANVLGLNGASYDIGNEDGLLIVLDIDSAVLAGPDGEQQTRSPGLPSIVVAKKVPASLDFADVPEPDGELHVSTLIEGTGPVVETDDEVKVNYLGQLRDGTVPFDESYSAEAPGPYSFAIGQGAVVKGWDQGLVGLTVGSRVILEIPPGLGYGKDGKKDTENPDKSIPGGATLYFLVDVLAAG